MALAFSYTQACFLFCFRNFRLILKLHIVTSKKEESVISRKMNSLEFVICWWKFVGGVKILTSNVIYDFIINFVEAVKSFESLTYKYIIFDLNFNFSQSPSLSATILISGRMNVLTRDNQMNQTTEGTFWLWRRLKTYEMMMNDGVLIKI